MISKQAKIGKGAEIQPSVMIGMQPQEGPVTIGENALVRSGTIIYSGVIIGNSLKTGHNVLIREKTLIGNNVMVGTNAVIDGNVRIGNNVSIQTNVYISTNSTIEDDAFLGPHCVITNDKWMLNPQAGKRAELIGATIRKGARIGANATLLPGITIGEGAIVGAGSVVTADVPPRKVAVGVPARVIKDAGKEGRVQPSEGQIETNSAALDCRRYVNENFAKADFDAWLLKNLGAAKGFNVLDLGCGSGKHLFKISASVGPEGKVVGVDIDKESLDKCRRQMEKEKIKNIELHNCDLTDFKEKINIKFDRILSSFAIYYTKDKDKTFNDCYDLLKEGGVLFICGPNGDSNAEFRSLVKKAGGTFTEDFMKWSAFLEKEAAPILKEIFGNTEVMIFKNPIVFPNGKFLYEYWKSTELYDKNIEDEMKAAIAEEFRRAPTFVNVKTVLALRCKK